MRDTCFNVRMKFREMSGAIKNNFLDKQNWIFSSHDIVKRIPTLMYCGVFVFSSVKLREGWGARAE